MSNPDAPQSPSTGPIRCLTGSLVAGTLAMLLYQLTQMISQSFAAHPLSATNQTAITISVAVRTLVVGLSTLATAICTLITLGLIGLALQQLWQRFSTTKVSS